MMFVATRMTPNPVTITSATSVADATHIMRTTSFAVCRLLTTEAGWHCYRPRLEGGLAIAGDNSLHL